MATTFFPRACDQLLEPLCFPLSRRRFLAAGAVGTLLNLPQLLQARAPSRSAGRRGTDKSCLFIVQQGGCSHIDTWDLKPDAPPEYRGPYKPIATPVAGIRICELMPRLARLADRYCLIRSLTHNSTDHDEGMHSVSAARAGRTGTPPTSARS